MYDIPQIYENERNNNNSNEQTKISIQIANCAIKQIKSILL